jgi:hypothetical protein
VVPLHGLVAHRLVGKIVRISIRVVAPSGANVSTDSKALGSSRNSPWRIALCALGAHTCAQKGGGSSRGSAR